LKLSLTNFQEIILTPKKNSIINSEEISMTTGRKYSVTTEVIGRKGEPFCAYFGVILLGQDGEIDRKIRWLNDFSGKKKYVNIIFNASTDKIIVIYRINAEMAKKSDCSFALLPVDQVTIKLVDKIPKKSKKTQTKFLKVLKKNWKTM